MQAQQTMDVTEDLRAKQVRMAVTRRVKELGRAGKVWLSFCESDDAALAHLAFGTMQIIIFSCWTFEETPDACMTLLDRLGKPFSNWQRWPGLECSQTRCSEQRLWTPVRGVGTCRWHRQPLRSFLAMAQV